MIVHPITACEIAKSTAKYSTLSKVFICVLHGSWDQELHLGHLGICKMEALARSYVWWPGVDSDIEGFVANSEAAAAVPATVPRHSWQHLNAPSSH